MQFSAVTPETLPVNNRKDFLLLLIAATGREPGEPIVGVTRLQKYLFLLQEKYRWHEKFGLEKPYQFEPFDYGPFDSQLYDDLALLENVGLIKREPVGPEPTAERDEAELLASEWGTADPEFAPWEEEPRVYAYSLTDKGKEFVRGLELPDEDKAVLDEIKRTWNQKSLNDLLRWLYKSFPPFAAKTKLHHLRPREVG